MLLEENKGLCVGASLEEVLGRYRHETPLEEGQVVARVEAVPERGDHVGGHLRLVLPMCVVSKMGVHLLLGISLELLLIVHAQVYVVPEPVLHRDVPHAHLVLREGGGVDPEVDGAYAVEEGAASAILLPLREGEAT